jgi:MFS family permease
MTERAARQPAEPTSLPRLPAWSPWRAVVGFGIVSLTADMVYEGARSMTGPLLAALGASAVVVGLVTGAGEAMALVLRLFSGTWADRSGRYWSLTVAGYALTAVCVPALAVTPFLAGAGLAVACALILAERTGKAVRSPAKSTLLAHAAGQVGMGKGIAVHKALDQAGAVLGPLLVAAVAAVTGALWPAFAVLIVPGAAAMIILVVLRRRVGDPVVVASGPTPPTGAGPTSDSAPPADTALQPTDTSPSASAGRVSRIGQLPTQFWLFAASAAAATAGLMTFGIIAYHLTVDQVVPVPTIPLVYAAAMAVEALAAVITGWLYDRHGARVLLVLPVLVAAVPPLAFTGSVGIAVAGILIWGAAVGVQDSTVKALVADLVPAGRRATAYGVFAAVQGGAAVVGGAAAAALYQHSLPALVGAVIATQVIAALLLVSTVRRSRAAGSAPTDQDSGS